MNTHPDFEELLRLLEENGVDYMIVGGYAVAFHGHPRFTKDIDLYPQMGRELDPVTTPTVTSGRRRVRLVLASVPFGYSGPDQQERCLRRFRELLVA